MQKTITITERYWYVFTIQYFPWIGITPGVRVCWIYWTVLLKVLGLRQMRCWPGMSMTTKGLRGLNRIKRFLISLRELGGTLIYIGCNAKCTQGNYHLKFLIEMI